MLPTKPDWFQPVFTEWDVPEEIPCPKNVPSSAEFIAEAMWAYAPGMDRVDRYQLSFNRGRKHLILWVGNPNEEDGGWIFAPVAYGPTKSSDGQSIPAWQATLHLMVAAWKGEKEQGGGFQPPQEVRGPLAGEDFEAVCREVWPELMHEAQ